MLKIMASSEGHDGYRVNKVLCEKYSRREADRLVAEGRVVINGVAATPGDRVFSTDRIEVDGRKVPFPHDRLTGGAVANRAAGGARGRARGGRGGSARLGKLVYIIYNKPAGVVCTTDQNIRGNIIDAVGHEKRIFPVGRLDKDTTGTILLTSDGRLPNAVLRAANKQPKVYEVVVDRAVSLEDVRKLEAGVVITTVAQRDRKAKPLTAPTLPCKVKQLGPKRLRITLREGRNRQVRRMLEALGYETVRLTRTAFMGISGDDVPRGYWRDCDEEEMRIIERALERAGQAGMDYSIDAARKRQSGGGANDGTRSRRRGSRSASMNRDEDRFGMPTGVDDGDPVDFYDLSELDLSEFSSGGDGDTTLGLTEFDFSDAVDLDLDD